MVFGGWYLAGNALSVFEMGGWARVLVLIVGLVGEVWVVVWWCFRGFPLGEISLVLAFPGCFRFVWGWYNIGFLAWVFAVWCLISG